MCEVNVPAAAMLRVMNASLVYLLLRQVLQMLTQLARDDGAKDVSTGSRLQELHGIGPSGAARLLGDIGRFASRAHFASWNGTAPIDASSGDQNRHRLSRAGNRRINRALHIMAIVQLRHDTEGRRYYRRKLAAGKTPMEAPRALKRRLSDVVYKQMVTDAKRLATGPGGHAGATLRPSAAAPNPHGRHFGQVTSRTRQTTA